MNGLGLRLAITAVRLWTRAYTWRLPAALRDARRDEIESDLWESQRDRAAGLEVSLALAIFARLIAGIADDLGWRIEYASGTGLRQARVALAVGFMGVLWVGLAVASRMPQLPPVPDAPRWSWQAAFRDAPPPPPPPPPPCAPPGFPGSSTRDCVR
jgi:hypothetical protein